MSSSNATTNLASPRNSSRSRRVKASSPIFVRVHAPRMEAGIRVSSSDEPEWEIITIELPAIAPRWMVQLVKDQWRDEYNQYLAKCTEKRKKN